MYIHPLRGCFSNGFFQVPNVKGYIQLNMASVGCKWCHAPHDRMPNIWQVTNVGQVLRKHLSHLEMSQSELKGGGTWSWHTFVCIRLSKSRQSSTNIVMSWHDRTKRQPHIGWMNLHEQPWHGLSQQVHVLYLIMLVNQTECIYHEPPEPWTIQVWAT